MLRDHGELALLGVRDKFACTLTQIPDRERLHRRSKLVPSIDSTTSHSGQYRLGLEALPDRHLLGSRPCTIQHHPAAVMPCIPMGYRPYLR